MAEEKNPTTQDASMSSTRQNDTAIQSETGRQSGARKQPNPAYAGLAAKLKSYRMAREMSQKDFAAFLGIPFRSYCNYEAGYRYPRNMEVVNRMAKALGVTAEALLGESGGYIVEANEKGGSRDRKKMEQMVTQLSAMFAGGEIDQESKDLAMAALNAVYWKHKEENRQRYTTKKNRDRGSDSVNEDADDNGTMPVEIKESNDVYAAEADDAPDADGADE